MTSRLIPTKWPCVEPLLLLLVVCKISALDNGLALTPPMGWLAWQRFRCTIDCDEYPDECVSEKLFMTTADALVDGGYAEVGYEYVAIDDCWMAQNRSADGILRADEKRFPRGIKALADYVHSKGLKFGIYQCVGNRSCAGYPGVKGHEETDARTFAEWGVDYVKLDGCYTNVTRMGEDFSRFGKYLNETGRPMMYSCCWPFYQEALGMRVNYSLVSQSCNTWRNYGDIQESYDSMVDVFNKFASEQDVWAGHAGPGSWNDPDMLLIGNFALSYDQSKTQMAVWAILAAPLMMSNKLSAVRSEFKSVLQNTEVIRVNQDRLGIQGRRIKTDQGIETWLRPIEPTENGRYSYAIAFVSIRTIGKPFGFKIALNDLGLDCLNGYKVTDLFADNGTMRVLKPNAPFKVTVNPSGVVMLRADIITKYEYIHS